MITTSFTKKVYPQNGFVLYSLLIIHLMVLMGLQVMGSNHHLLLKQKAAVIQYFKQKKILNQSMEELIYDAIKNHQLIENIVLISSHQVYDVSLKQHQLHEVYKISLTFKDCPISCLKKTNWIFIKKNEQGDLINLIQQGSSFSMNQN